MERLFPETIETERLMLRGPRLSDAQDIYNSYGQDPAVSKYMVWRPALDVAEPEAFISQAIGEWQSGKRYAFVLELKNHKKELIGMLDARIKEHTVDVGYVLARKYWGRGMMPEALAVLSDLALKNESIFRVQATCDIDNNASIRILEKCGFIREGRLERFLVHPNISDEPRPCFIYSLCR